jgi:hypothetical protein
MGAVAAELRSDDRPRPGRLDSLHCEAWHGARFRHCVANSSKIRPQRNRSPSTVTHALIEDRQLGDQRDVYPWIRGSDHHAFQPLRVHLCLPLSFVGYFGLRLFAKQICHTALADRRIAKPKVSEAKVVV